MQHPFRFAISGSLPTSRTEWVALAQKVEALGYSTLVLGEHPTSGGGPFAALMAAADATTTLRIGSHVLANDFRPPVLLAQEMAMLDLLSEGRVEFGIGSGWAQVDYANCGVPFDPPRVRIERLAEAVALLKRLFGDEPVTFQGRYYQVKELNLLPKPKQRPHPPLYIGGGGRRVLTLAAQEAAIVGLDAKGTQAGTKDLATTTTDALAQQIAWVREAAGTRFSELELHLLIYNVIVTEDRQQGAQQVAAGLAAMSSTMMSNTSLTMEQILASPRYLIGTEEQIMAQLQACRERYGVSYFTIFARYIDAFRPIVAQLAGR